MKFQTYIAGLWKCLNTWFYGTGQLNISPSLENFKNSKYFQENRLLGNSFKVCDWRNINSSQQKYSSQSSIKKFSWASKNTLDSERRCHSIRTKERVENKKAAPVSLCGSGQFEIHRRTNLLQAPLRTSGD